MEYVLFLGLQRIGSVYPNIDEAKKAINQKGIWNVCAITPINGKLSIISRETIIK
jgi:hypothetical protein